MCMEDIRLGRKTTANGYQVAVGVTSTPFVPYNPKRIALIMGSASAAFLLLALNADPTVTTHLAISGSGGNIVLNIKDHGTLVHGPWNAAFSGAGAGACWSETLLDAQ